MIQRTERDRIVRRLLLEDAGGRECRYCSWWYLEHPGFSDHEDFCPLNPINRPHICGTANAPGLELDAEVLL